MRTYPTETSNCNVPANVFLVAEVEQCSGELVTTFYIDRCANIKKVSDWTGNKPQPATMSELCRLTLDSEKMIESRWKRALEEAQ